MYSFHSSAEKTFAHEEKLILFSTGRILNVPTTIYESACHMDMKDFPFDTQQCNFKFGSWSYPSEYVDLVRMFFTPSFCCKFISVVENN